MVVLQPGVHCDPCIAPIVKALNNSDLPTVPSKHNPDGVRTVASCCGHGKQPAHIALADGREVFVADPEWAEAIWAAIATKRTLRQLVGRLWEMLKTGDAVSQTIHATNSEMAIRMCESLEREFSAEPLDDTWIEFRAEAAT